MSTMPIITVRVEADLQAAMLRIAVRHNKTRSWIVRMALRRGLPAIQAQLRAIESAGLPANEEA